MKAWNATNPQSGLSMPDAQQVDSALLLFLYGCDVAYPGTARAAVACGEVLLSSFAVASVDVAWCAQTKLSYINAHALILALLAVF